MKNIIIRFEELSQQHAGQIVEHSAHICRDTAGQWYSVIGTHDRSGRDGWKHDVVEHPSQRAADGHVMQALSVSSDRTVTVDLGPVRRLNTVLRKYDCSPVSVHFDAATLDLTISRGNRQWRGRADHLAISDVQDVAGIESVEFDPEYRADERKFRNAAYAACS